MASDQPTSSQVVHGHTRSATAVQNKASISEVPRKESQRNSPTETMQIAAAEIRTGRGVKIKNGKNKQPLFTRAIASSRYVALLQIAEPRPVSGRLTGYFLLRTMVS